MMLLGVALLFRLLLVVVDGWIPLTCLIGVWNGVAGGGDGKDGDGRVGVLFLLVVGVGRVDCCLVLAWLSVFADTAVAAVGAGLLLFGVGADWKKANCGGNDGARLRGATIDAPSSSSSSLSPSESIVIGRLEFEGLSIDFDDPHGSFGVSSSSPGIV